MQTMPLLAAAAAVLLLAGCTEPPTATTPGPTVVDTITPGAWRVSAATDRILVWAHNDGSSPLSVTWSFTGAAGAALPEGWSISFDPPTADLQPAGSKSGSGRRIAYTDWTWSLATLTITGAMAPAPRALELHAGPLNAPIAVEVAAGAADVTGPDDRVNVQYRGTFTASGEEFDSGDFPTTLGSGQTVPGFDYGLMGLDVDEPASLVLPPALAYGYDNDPSGSYARFNGQWLTFDVTVLSVE